ncbi:MAG: TatD family hydrolase [Planctomycetales bacterium]|nr:TatD family hydrolase [Planctomycetales bacterium]
MYYFDPHIHMYARVTDDYERMALAGIRATIEPAFWLGQPRKHPGSFLDYFAHLTGYEVSRAGNFGIELFASLAMNPREANDRKLAEDVIAGMPPFLAHPRTVAVGEVGFDSITDAEEEALRRQLELARQHGLPVIVHTPHRNKLDGVKRILAVLREMRYDMERVNVDHNTEETVGIVREAGAWAGHTVYPVTKLSPERAVNILERWGTERMLVNSSADWGVSDPLSVPKVAIEMRRRGFSEDEIRRTVWENPIEFFSPSGKLGPLLQAAGEAAPKG